MELRTSRPRPDPIRGEPVESFARIFEDDQILVGIWECTPGRFPVSRDGSHSFMQIISGAGHIIDATGVRHELRPGSVHVEPDLWSGEWDITDTVRKFYVIKKTS